MALDNLKLPIQLISQGDVGRVRRELKDLDDFICQANLRQPGTPLKTLPKTSRGLSDFAAINKINLLNEGDRESATASLNDLIVRAPVVHISFAVDPSAAFMAKIAIWFRDKIDPLTLINVGLEPNIAAGCTLQTDNHYHDFSLRQHFYDQHQLLMTMIKGEAAR